MEKKARNIAAVVSLCTSFAGVAGVCLYAGFNWGKENADKQAYEAGYQAFQDELSACHDAQKNAGILLGDYLLGENAVTESNLNTAEANAAVLCAKFEFSPD